MNDLIANYRSAGLARRGVAALAFLAALAVGLLSTACGGGGSTDDGGGNGGGTSGRPTGALYWISASSGSKLNLAAGTKQAQRVADLAPATQGQLGYGGGMFTDVEVTGNFPSNVTVNLRDATPSPYTLRSRLGPFPLDGTVGGPVQPSPDGQLFAMFTQENSITYVYVFDAALDIVFKPAGYESRSWLGNDRVVVTKGSNLYTVTVTDSPVVTRIGSDGLGLPSEAVRQPSVSPDGRSISYVQGSMVWRINIDGSGLMQLTKPRVDTGWPSWSPDGSWLVVSTSPCSNIGDEVFTISATTPEQDLSTTDFVTSTCGPVYWLPS